MLKESTHASSSQRVSPPSCSCGRPARPKALCGMRLQAAHGRNRQRQQRQRGAAQQPREQLLRLCRHAVHQRREGHVHKHKAATRRGPQRESTTPRRRDPHLRWTSSPWHPAGAVGAEDKLLDVQQSSPAASVSLLRSTGKLCCAPGPNHVAQVAEGDMHSRRQRAGKGDAHFVSRVWK